MSVYGVVARNVESRQLVNIPNRKVVLQLSEYIERRSYVELMARARHVRVIWSWVKAGGIFPDIHLQIAVRAGQLPPRDDLVLGEKFGAIRAAVHFVTGNEWSHQVQRGRVGLHKRCPRLS